MDCLSFSVFSLAAATFVSIEYAKAKSEDPEYAIPVTPTESLFEFFSNVLIYILPNLHSAMSNGSIRANIKEGLNVGIVLKEDQRSGKITQGVVKRILTNSPTHPHGIKVQLTNGQVGRVKEIYSKPEK